MGLSVDVGKLICLNAQSESSGGTCTALIYPPSHHRRHRLVNNDDMLEPSKLLSPRIILCR